MSSLLKNSVNIGRLTLAVILVVAFSTALWFASPEPAQAITVNVPNPTDAQVASPVAITVVVNVQNGDQLPVGAVELQIAHATQPGTYSVTIPNLPIPNGPSQTVNGNYSGTGSATISVLSGAGWGSGTMNRFGYGYGYSGSTANLTFGNTFGYGYGYGGSYVGSTNLTYTIVWTPPANWPAGQYTVNALVYGTPGSTASAFTSATPGIFNLTAAPLPPAGGGLPPDPGTTVITGSISPSGLIMTDIVARSVDDTVTVDIPQGTTARQANGLPLAAVTVVPLETPPAPPEDGNVIGIPYNLGPTGATFDPPITVTLNVNLASLPAGVDIDDLVIAFYDTATGEWVELTDIVVDVANGTISGRTSHFTVFAIIAPAPAVTTVSPSPTTPTATTTTTSPAPTTQTTTTTTVAPGPTTTGVDLPPPSQTGTVILPPGSGTGDGGTGTNWLWPIIIGVVGIIVMVFVVRYGWNLRRD